MCQINLLFLFSHQMLLTFCDLMDCSQAPLSSTVSRICSNSCPLNHVTISKHLILCYPLLLLPSIFPSIMVFSNVSALCIRWPSIGTSALASVLSMNIQNWFPSGLTGMISLLTKGLKSLLQHHRSKASILWFSASLWFNSHIHTWLLENNNLDY